MKIKYDKPKEQRVKRYFFGMTCKDKDGQTYWYYDKLDKWCNDKEDMEELSNDKMDC